MHNITKILICLLALLLVLKIIFKKDVNIVSHIVTKYYQNTNIDKSKLCTAMFTFVSMKDGKPIPHRLSFS